MNICARCKWQVPDLVDGLCDYCYNMEVEKPAAVSHLHECMDCDEVWTCFGHDCTGSNEYKCADCFMQMRLLEFND